MTLSNFSACILSGGKGSRFKGKKHEIYINNTSVIQHQVNILRQIADDIMVVTKQINNTAKIAGARIIIEADETYTPLVGIAKGMEESFNEYLFVTGCDMPFIQNNVISKIHANTGDYELVVPLVNGRYQMLSAIYKRSIRPIIEDSINNRNFRLDKLISKANTTVLTDFTEQEQQHFVNINYKKELEKFGLRYNNRIIG